MSTNKRCNCCGMSGPRAELRTFKETIGEHSITICQPCVNDYQKATGANLGVGSLLDVSFMYELRKWAKARALRHQPSFYAAMVMASGECIGCENETVLDLVIKSCEQRGIDCKPLHPASGMDWLESHPADPPI